MVEHQIIIIQLDKYVLISLQRLCCFREFQLLFPHCSIFAILMLCLCFSNENNFSINKLFRIFKASLKKSNNDFYEN